MIKMKNGNRYGSNNRWNCAYHPMDSKMSSSLNALENAVLLPIFKEKMSRRTIARTEYIATFPMRSGLKDSLPQFKER